MPFGRAMIGVGSLFGIALFCAALPLRGQGPPTISTDRPGQATPPSLVPIGTVQLEVGLHYGRDDVAAGGVTETMTTIVVPGVLVRFGLLERMELRLATDVRRVEVAQGGEPATSVSGLGGVALGAKIGIAVEEGMRPELALIAMFGLPSVGYVAFRPAAVAPSLTLSARHALPCSTTLYYNVGGAWDGENGAGTGLYSVSVSPLFSGQVYGFAELYGELKTGMAPTHAVDAGVAWVVGPSVQLDLFGGLGLTGNAPSFFVHGGVCVRLPR
jgi:hypothetical protein